MAQTRKTVRIAVVSRSPIRLAGLSALLSQHGNFTVLPGCIRSTDVVTTFGRTDPEVILIDDYADSDYPELHSLLAVLQSSTPARVVLLTQSLPKNSVRDFVADGVRGIVAQDAPPDVLFKSIRSVAAGEYWLGRERIADLLSHLTQRKWRTTTHDQFGLTAKEREIIHYVVRGYANSEIAEHLGISSQAVRHRLSRVFARLGVANRLELALFALEHELETSE